MISPVQPKCEQDLRVPILEGETFVAYVQQLMLAMSDKLLPRAKLCLAQGKQFSQQILKR